MEAAENRDMLSLYRTLSLRYLSRRWFRALLVVASIMLGVATLVATQALSATMSKASYPGRIAEVGIEHIRFVAPPRSAGVEWAFLRMDALADAWV